MWCLAQIISRSKVDSFALLEHEDNDMGAATLTGEVQSRVSFVVGKIKVAFGGLQSSNNFSVASDTCQMQRGSVGLGERIGPDILLSEE
jgi:hypothetical protein